MLTKLKPHSHDDALHQGIKPYQNAHAMPKEFQATGKTIDRSIGPYLEDADCDRLLAALEQLEKTDGTPQNRAH